MVLNQVNIVCDFRHRNEGTFRVLIKWARGLGLEGGVIEGRGVGGGGRGRGGWIV